MPHQKSRRLIRILGKVLCIGLWLWLNNKSITLTSHTTTIREDMERKQLKKGRMKLNKQKQEERATTQTATTWLKAKQKNRRQTWGLHGNSILFLPLVVWENVLLFICVVNTREFPFESGQSVGWDHYNSKQPKSKFTFVPFL